MKFRGSRTRKDWFDKDEAVNDYSVTLTESGKNYPAPCISIAKRDGMGLVTFGDMDEFFTCASALHDYSFNLKNHRFWPPTRWVRERSR
jgi:hypothetical protein